MDADFLDHTTFVATVVNKDRLLDDGHELPGFFLAELEDGLLDIANVFCADVRPPLEGRDLAHLALKLCLES